ncbi:CST complex subunit Ten1 [Stachybotrys elegans]|uniref:CST complex subunit Ten1 n=1 Tax=Stachybotrys elegans TaxID=80388 RepID=A0A8K0T409_9HYPO|nr:CST complex subunit Ten1 [Stachybotrys elegans]
MSRGPLPSKLHLLSSLPGCSEGDKVRFLGCIASYSTQHAVLSLQHPCPKGTNVTAFVNVQLLLPALNSELTNVGEWINVIGYVTSHSGSRPTNEPRPPITSSVHIKAMMIWPTGPLDLQFVQGALFNRQGSRDGVLEVHAEQR